MSYSIDLRERAVTYVQEGGSQVEASRMFGVSTRTLYNWLHRSRLQPTKVVFRRRKLDKVALAAHVRNYPDAFLRERAAAFGVSSVAIFKALRQLKLTKKNDAVR